MALRLYHGGVVLSHGMSMCIRSSQWILRITLYASWWTPNERTRKIWKSSLWWVLCAIFAEFL